MDNIYILPEVIPLSQKMKSNIITDYNRFATGLPKNVEEYILSEYELNLGTTYDGQKIKNPFGKAAGQLSMNINQIKKDIEAGLGFIVLKTVIAEDEAESSEMSAWKVKSPQMKVEEIISKNGKRGWTVTWKGRGWTKSFSDYLDFMEKSLELGRKEKVPIIPSCQYHLPDRNEGFNKSEYNYTTKSLLQTWHKVQPEMPMMLEQDFSPTLLSDNLKTKKQLKKWLQNAPDCVKGTVNSSKIKLGLKLLNTPFSDQFQVDMLNLVNEKAGFVDWMIAFNRLFDPHKTFKGKKGIAYGGYDLSDRNLRVLSQFRKNRQYANNSDIPISATGNINSGKMMVEYALRGCKNGQIHTFFQLPSSEYKMKKGSHTARALHELLFNPDNGLVTVLSHLKEEYGFTTDGILRFDDITNLYREVDVNDLLKK